MHTKTTLEDKDLVKKTSQTFFGNTSVQQNIVKSISNSFLDFQWLTKTTHVPVLLPYNAICSRWKSFAVFVD